MSVSALLTAFFAFVGTTIDDVIVVTALFVARKRTGRPTAVSIVTGQYAGFAAILLVSLLAAAGLRIVPEQWVGLLGLVPIGFGVWGLWRLRASATGERRPLAVGTWRIAAIACADGADNLSVFTPLFRSFHVVGSLLATALFLGLIGVLCAAGALLGSRHTLVKAIRRIGPRLVPVVFIGVGVMVLVTGFSAR